MKNHRERFAECLNHSQVYWPAEFRLNASSLQRFTGILASRINNYLNGTTPNPTAEFFIGIHLNCPINGSYWLFGEGEMFKPHPSFPFLNLKKYSLLEDEESASPQIFSEHSKPYGVATGGEVMEFLDHLQKTIADFQKKI